MASPADDAFRETLGQVTAGAVPAAPLLRRSVSTWTLLRLGLREFAGGLISVLILGVLNRVMKVELGINLAIIAAILASYNLAAPIALVVGHRSDTRPIFGKRRIPYILGGTALSSIALLLAPHLAGRLSEGITLPVVLLGILLFVLLGIGTYSSGAVFLALLSDVVPERERGNAISIVYFELVLGVLAGVALSGAILDGDAGGLGTLFAVAAVVVFALTTFGVWGMEPDEQVTRAPTEHVPVLVAVRRIAAMPRARQFFVFMTLATVFLFLQQAVLEPFGGEVLGLDVRATNAFNAVQMIGVLVAMVLGGRGIADRWGHKKLAGVGLWVAAGSFALLTFAAVTESAPPSWFAILGLGLGMGLFSVAGLARRAVHGLLDACPRHR
jgi:BCD family chlorophyll transporter-like MFS transporter